MDVIDNTEVKTVGDTTYHPRKVFKSTFPNYKKVTPQNRVCDAGTAADFMGRKFGNRVKPKVMRDIQDIVDASDAPEEEIDNLKVTVKKQYAGGVLNALVAERLAKNLISKLLS
jgi:hypothetical protein